MTVYGVLYDRPIGYNDYCETEIVEVFKYRKDAEEYARDNDNYRIEEWEVNSLFAALAN
jgi:hypothetical protein